MAYSEPVRAGVVDCSIYFQAADIWAPYGKYSQPVNSPLHHTEWKVFSNVCYTPLRSLCFWHIFLCSGELLQTIMADKMYARGTAEIETKKHRKSIIPGVNMQGFQQLKEPLMKRSR